jgi:zinc protease
MRLLSAGGLVAALVTIAAATPAAALQRPETFTLDNGMEVVVITDRRAPVVTHMVWYRVGSADEPRGKSGIAHFLEHLMFKGTRQVAPGEFSKIIARNGGDDNAFTSNDYTAYHQRIARDRLELVMRMEADRMRNLRLDDSEVLPERDVIIEERRQRTDNSPGARLMEQARAMLYPHHPYGTPVIGWLHEMAGLTRQDAIAFYRQHYAPNNAILVVAGDVNAAELKPLAQRHYGRLARGPELPARDWAQDPPPQGPMRVSLSDPKVRQPSFVRLYRSISYSTDTGRQAHALDVAMEVLGGSETSFLYRTLVEEKKLAVNVSASADTSGIGGGRVTIGATPADGVTLERLEAEVDALIATFLREGPNAAEVERAKNNLSAQAIYLRDSQESLANIWGSSLATGESVDDVVNWADDVMKVTPAEAHEMARNTLIINGSVTGTLLPETVSEAKP